MREQILALLERNSKMTPEEMLTAVTLNAAAAIGRADRLGSLEVGKDADLVIWTDDPLRVIGGRSWKTFVNGQLVCEDEA